MPGPPVVIGPYDPAWPSMFEAERDLIERQIAPLVAGGIEHIGSTAVAGLPAKPVIDIMVGVRSLDSSRAAIPLLEPLGYHYFPYQPDVMHWFCKPSDPVRTHHLHLVPFRSALWRERLTFRDHLRAHPDACEAYATLKRRLAAQHRDDREAYTEQKSAFIDAILSTSRRRRS